MSQGFTKPPAPPSALVGPASATDGAVVAFDGTSGKLAKNTTTTTTTTGLVVPKAAGSGVKVDPTAPTYPWHDQLGTIRPKTSGANTPVAATFRGGQYQAYAFSAGDLVDFEFHVPHDWVLGTDMYLHLHWSHNGTAISGSLVLDWYITTAKGHNQADFGAEVNKTQTVSTPDIATIPRYRHRIDEFQLSASAPGAGQIDTDDIEVDGLILVRLVTTTIPTITGGSVNKPFIFLADLHYQSTGTGTKQKAPDFYT